MRGGQVARHLRELSMLGARRTGVTVAELAAELNVGVRTIYRDLAVLEEVGVPLIKHREGPVTVWRMLESDTWRLGVPLGLAEIVALHLASKLLEIQGGQPWSDALRSALEKLDAAVPGKLLQRLEEHLSGLTVSERGARPYRKRREILAAVTRALAEQRPMDVHYATPGRVRPVARRLHPLALHLSNGALYLVADDQLRKEVRTFLVDRIRLATVIDARFERPDDFHIDDYFADAFAVHRGGKVALVRVRFSHAVAHLVEERQWHPTVRTLDTPEGLEVSLKVRDSPELRAWIRSFGAQATVLAPASLARELALEAEASLKNYAAARGRQTKSGRRTETPRERRARVRKSPDGSQEG